MHVAIIGSGLAGLATAIFLKKRGARITIYESPNSKGASEIAAGLLHPYPGPSGKKSKFADAAMKETIELLDLAEKSLGEKVSLRNGILRKGWENAPEEEPDILKTKEGHIIQSGITVNMPKYLKGLRKSLSDASFETKEIYSLEELNTFDVIIVAAGVGVKKFFPDLPVKGVKGQLFRAMHPEFKTEKSIIGKGHLSPSGNGEILIGSSYEHGYQTENPDEDAAKKYLSSRIAKFFPPLESFTILECQAGIRMAVNGSYLPIIQQLNNRHYVFTGLGSRGLLYHAYYGRLLSKMV